MPEEVITANSGEPTEQSGEPQVKAGEETSSQKPEVSQSVKEEVSQKEAGNTSATSMPKTEKELNDLIASRIKAEQSNWDKGTIKIREEHEKAKARIAELEDIVADKKETKNLLFQEAAEKEEMGEDNPEVLSFQESRRKFYDDKKEAKARYAQYEKNKAELDKLFEATNKEFKRNELRNLAIAHLIDEDALKSVDELVKAMEEAKDPKLYLEKKALEEQIKNLSPQHNHVPGNTTPSASGGIDMSHMSSREMIKEGLKKKS